MSRLAADGWVVVLPGPAWIASNHEGHGLPIALTSSWQEYRLPLAEVEQAGWGYPVPFDPTAVVTVQFEVPGDGRAFDICVDDVRFY